MTILNICGEKKAKKFYPRARPSLPRQMKNSLFWSPLKKESADSHHYFTPTAHVSAGQTSATPPAWIPLIKSS